LGAGQTLAWASSYYLPALLAQPMAADLGTSAVTVFGAFSLALVVSALLGPRAGRAIDRHGGRLVLAATNLLFALGLVMLATCTGTIGLFLAWGVIGIAMGSGLYDAAFAALVRVYGQAARGPITGITLIAGFASTIGWPLTGWLEASFGWRNACLVWAALHLVLGLPLNLVLPRVRNALAAAAATASAAPAASAPVQDKRVSMVLLSVVFAITWFTSTAMAAHLPALLQTLGLPLAVALSLAALVGPAQVGARLLEFGLLRKMHPLLSARLATAAHPVGAVLVIGLGAPLALVFTLLHGAGNGILTIAKGTLPLVVFGAHGYGARQGLLMAPARLAQAAAPLLFGVLVQRWGGDALWFSAALGVLAFGCLLAIKVDERR
jgi:MFS family permease